MSDSEQPTDPKIAQRLDRSLNFWAMEKEDYPPAIRGVVAHIGDLASNVRETVQELAADPTHPDLQLKRLIWFEDKNDKLDEACAEARRAFRAYKVNADGLIAFDDSQNPLMEKPTKHRIVVDDEFAATNYNQTSNDLFIDEDEEDDEDEEMVEEETKVKPKSWKRKISQTLKPWSVLKDGKVGYARTADDLMVTMNTLFSRTKHGWLLVYLIKLKRRRGSCLLYAITFENQKIDDQRFEFQMELFGTATAYRKRLAERLTSLSRIFLDIDESGEVYLSRVSAYREEEKQEHPNAKPVVVPLDARIVSENGKPSQVVLKPTGSFFEGKLKPLIEKQKALSTKIDLRKSSSDSKRFEFELRLELDGPLLVGSSGDAIIFQLNDFMHRFADTSIEKVKAESQQKS